MDSVGSRGANAKPPSTERHDEAYLPLGMIRAYVYCPRLFYYEHVEGTFVPNQYTLDGEDKHRRVHREPEAFPEAEALEEGERIRARSLRLASERLGIIGVLDLVEAENGRVVPIDYKRGRPRIGASGAPEAWPAERAQMIGQVLILRDNGYHCPEGIIYYCSTKQRVRVPVGPEEEEWFEAQLRGALAVAEKATVPPPLFNSPKCDGCSLAPVCLPDETWAVRLAQRRPRHRQRMLFGELDRKQEEPDGEARVEVRPLATSLTRGKPLYVNTQGAHVRVSGRRLIIALPDGTKQELLCKDISHVALFGNVQCTTQSLRTLVAQGIPVAFFTYGGWFVGFLHGLDLTNALLRHDQHVMAERRWFCLELARELVVGKIENQRVLIQRNHIEPPPEVLVGLKHLARLAAEAPDLESLRGIEGAAGRLYFQHFDGLIKRGKAEAAEEEDADEPQWTFDFRKRNRRPPRDPVNALLSLAYSVLCKDFTVTCQLVGLDPYVGFYHQMRPRRPALALDLMEPFRPLVADAAVYTAINRGMVKPKHFVRAGGGVNLTDAGRAAFFRAYEQRMAQSVTHPLFGYQVTYRGLLELQARLLARLLRGELGRYPVFRVR